MIVANVTVYRCDDELCDLYFTVTDERDELRFQKQWFVGMTKQFCPKHRGKIHNQALIIAEEARLNAIANRGFVKFKSIQEVQNNGHDSNRRTAA